MQNGTTYIVRPRMQPANRPSSFLRISPGSAQWLVGPASSSRSEQMKVWSSTRATSLGSESARYEFGRLASESFSNVPASTIIRARASYSSALPSHQCTASGCVTSLTSSTHRRSAWLRVGTVVLLTGSDQLLVRGRSAIVPYRTYSTSPSAGVAPASRLGTRTSRLNSATRTPSWLRTRVWTRTVPRSGLERDSLTSRTSDSQNSVSPWKTGAGCLSSSVARLAIALPETSETLMPSARE